MLIQSSSINQIIAIENLCWKTANLIFKRECKKRINEKKSLKRAKYKAVMNSH